MTPGRMPALAGLSRLRRSWRGRAADWLASRPDREHEMSFNRLAIATIIVATMLIGGSSDSRDALLGMAAFIALALCILLHILWVPGVNRTRRFLALLLDSVFLSWQLHIGGESVAMFFPVYLWVTFGNGFRFGLRWLHLSMLTTTAGFLAVTLTTPFWREHPPLTAGLMAGLLALPAYAGTLIRRLSRARQQAEEANQAKTLFMASVSHELRTPLNAIIGMGSLLRETRLNGEQAEMAQTVHEAANSLLSLIDDILDLSRIEAGRMPVQPVAFDLLDLMRESRGMVLAQAQAKGLAVVCHLTARSRIGLRGSRRHLSEILLNLMGNAVKFTATGGVLLAADSETLADGRVRLILEVSDTGIGIAPEAQARIFESFTQADPSILNQYGGTGLGLSIARRLAQLMGGDLVVRSTRGAGTTFQLSLELEAAAEEPQARHTQLDAVLLCGATPAGARVREGLAALGVPVEMTDDLDAALQSVLAGSDQDGRRKVLVAVADDAAWTVSFLAERLRGIDRSGDLAPVLVRAEAGMEDEADLRWHFAGLVGPDCAAAELAAALRVAGARLGAAAPASQGQARPDGQRPLRILVADDNRINQRVVTKILERAGHAAYVAEDGQAALDLLDDPAEPFDLVLMDVNMPRMDGLEATKLYRFAALGSPHLPIVALTADASADMAQRCLEAGMDLCLTKPVEPAQLLDVIASLAGVPMDAPADTVVLIAEHPKFRPTVAGALDTHSLNTLTELGGTEFVVSVIEEFLAESEGVVRDLGVAAHRGEVAAFRSHAHALRSSAVNIGALPLGKLCDSWQGFKGADLAEQAPIITARVAAEIDRVRDALGATRRSASVLDQRG